MTDVTHPVSVVYGGTGSIGSELVQQLLAAGHKVLVAARDAQKLQSLQSERDVEICQIDLGSPDSMSAPIKQAQEKFGQVNGVANCLGTLLLKPAHQTSFEAWQETLNVNLTSAFLILQAAIPAMRSAGGSIVFVSSAAAELGMANHEAIASAKAGLLGLMRSAAATYVNRSIRVNCVSPGLVKTNMTRHLWEDEKVRAASAAMNPMSQLGEPTDIARMITWLLSPENGWVTGQNYAVDGGLSSLMQRPKTKL